MGQKPRRSLKNADKLEGVSKPTSATKSASGDARWMNSIAELFSGMGAIEFRLSREQYVSRQELAGAIEASPSEVLPDKVRDCLCRHLRGQVKKKPGPKSPWATKELYEHLASIEYEKELRRLQAERKARGGRAVKGELAPHEEAARIIQRRHKYFRRMSPRRIANILSSRKYR
jgi:hypothetical protein